MGQYRYRDLSFYPLVDILTDIAQKRPTNLDSDRSSQAWAQRVDRIESALNADTHSITAIFGDRNMVATAPSGQPKLDQIPSEIPIGVDVGAFLVKLVAPRILSFQGSAFVVNDQPSPSLFPRLVVWRRLCLGGEVWLASPLPGEGGVRSLLSFASSRLTRILTNCGKVTKFLSANSWRYLYSSGVKRMDT
jgi:hypothetical protein